MNFLNELYAAISPVFLDLIGAALTALLLWLSRALLTRWGIEIEARDREALHSALMTGVRVALARGLDARAAALEGVIHARNSTPDAIRRLKPTATVLGDIAAAKVEEHFANKSAIKAVTTQ